MRENDSTSVISLPQGGGSVEGLGEKFVSDLHTGTGNFSVPIAVPPGRNDFKPSINLSYSTGNGNGAFGLGWNIQIPNITRKTSLGIPRYNENFSPVNTLNDVFLLSGFEDLVPVSGGYPGRVRYRPRTEGLFARIEHVSDAVNNYWEIRTKDGLTSYYGAKKRTGLTDSEIDAAVIRDFASKNPHRIFSWKLTETLDTFGNKIVYEYLRDSGEKGGHGWSQPLLKKIKYVDYGHSASPSFLVHIEFSYEPRPDAFSEYRAGFDIRTTLRCSKITIKTVLADGTEHKSQEYSLGYEQAPHNGVSLLSKIELIGFDNTGNLSNVFPPLTFGYSRFEPSKKRFNRVTGQALPEQAITGSNMNFVNLQSNGLPDLVEMNNRIARYWRNLGEGKLDLPKTMEFAPSLRLSTSGVRFIDANGEGTPDLLAVNPSLTGYYPISRFAGWGWKSFKPYIQAPSVSFEDPEVKLIDLDGDGVTDILRSGRTFECFFNHPDQSLAWQRTAFIERAALDLFPNVNFSDQRVHLADLSGDGLQDIVLINNGSIDYWSNLGHGRWGTRIRMKHSPRFPEGYNPQHILLGDVDGDGLADLIYVENGKVLLWINQSGNGWSANPITISGTPLITNNDNVRLIDLEGNGVSGLLWTSDVTSSAKGNMRFLDFTGGQKPCLLNQIDNNIGAETHIEYRSSTKDYLRDSKDPRMHWKTSLPFPVQVVAKVEVIDHVSKGRLTTGYSYHHGYWDGAEREFRGFGMVEQFDTETFEDFNTRTLSTFELGFDNIGNFDRQKQFSMPTLLKTWFHLGPVGEESGDWREIDYQKEFWSGDSQTLSRPHNLTELLGQLPRRAKRDALRSLRGNILRTELYALDRTERENLPFTVTESCFGLKEKVPLLSANEEVPPRRIFFSFLAAQRTTQWERGIEPLTQLSFTGDYDAFGQPQKHMTIAVPRGQNYQIEGGSSESFLATLTETAYAQRVEPECYIADRLARTVLYEVVNDGQNSAFQLWEQVQAGSVELRPLKFELRYYDGVPFEGLPYKQLGIYGALVRTENLVMTEEILLESYRAADGNSNPPKDIPPYLVPNNPTNSSNEYPLEFTSRLPNLAGYVHHREGEGSPYLTGYYAASVKLHYDFHEDGVKARGLVTISSDPLDFKTFINYDAPYRFLPVEIINPVGTKITALNNYRVLKPEEVTDSNGNISRVNFSPLGLVDSVYIQGNNGEGDRGRPSVKLEYDLLAFHERRQPISVRTIRHIYHDSQTDIAEEKRDETLEDVKYSDGFGRLIQSRTQAEDSLIENSIFDNSLSPVGSFAVPGEFSARERNINEPPNVVVSGWQIYDNKGRVVEKYEPFFSSGWSFTPLTEDQLGKKITLHYDASGKLVKTVNPDNSKQIIVFGVPIDLSDPANFQPTPWETYIYDGNDNAGRTHPIESALYNHHWNTPQSSIIDTLGLTIQTMNRNGTDPNEWYATRSTYDLRGNLLTVTDELGRIAFKYSYDLLGRRLRTEQLDGGIRRMIFDAAGNLLEQRESNGALMLQIHDSLQRRTHLWARDNANETSTLREQNIFGDNFAESGLDAEAAKRLYLLGRLYKQYDEAGELVFRSYDFKGNIQDKIRRVIRDSILLEPFDAPPADWGLSPPRIDWQPPAGMLLESYAETLLDSTVYHSSFSYDALNRVRVMNFPQDVEGTRKELSAHYNNAGALERIELNGSVFVRHIAYNARGQRTLTAFRNGCMTRYFYDAETCRIKRLRSEKYEMPEAKPLTFRPTASAMPIQDFTYEYDLAGNIIKILDFASGSGILNNPESLLVESPQLAQLLVAGDALLRHFEYDPLYRLLSATGREHALASPNLWDSPVKSQDMTIARGYTESYEYDRAGNLKQLNHKSNGSSFNRKFKLKDDANRLETMTVGADSFDYKYDASGSLVSETSSRHFEWDYNHRLRVYRTQTEGAPPSVYAQYLYDSAGQRVKKIVRKQGGSIEITVCIDGVFEHHYTRQGNAFSENNTLHVTHDQNRIALIRVGAPFAGDTTPAVKYNFADHLSSSNVVVNHVGDWINREEYTPYGETSFGSFTFKRYRFTGKERDEESGFYYHGARYYAPWIARWISCDPIKKDGLNAYAYVKNSPLNQNDPTGAYSENAVESSKREVAASVESNSLFSNIEDKNKSLSTGDNLINIKIRYPLVESFAETNSDAFSTNRRELTPDERKDASKIFGTSMNLDKVRIVKSNIANSPTTLGNTIRIQMHGTIDRGTLIHELMHVWQYQTSGTGYISASINEQVSALLRTGSRDAAYDLVDSDLLVPSIRNLPVEKQAVIVENFFNNNNGAQIDPNYQRFIKQVQHPISDDSMSINIFFSLRLQFQIDLFN